MIRILLAPEVYTVIDDADVKLVSGFPWRLIQPKGPDYMQYAHAWNGYQHFYMHRLIAGAGKTQQVDHEDRNGLNNQRHNLRLCSPSQNHANRIRERKAVRTSQFKGVYWDKSRDKWSATVHVDGKTHALGRYLDEEDAARAYDEAALRYWGEFARLNFPVDNGELRLEDLL